MPHGYNKAIPIIPKAILTESELETVQNSTWVCTAWDNSIYGILSTYITQI